MKQIKFKSIELLHFGKHDILQKDFGQITRIGGENESGKTTIQRAIRWIFNGKDDNGQEISGIRQHGKDGVDSDLDCIADLTLDVDGEGIELCKNFHIKTKKTGEFDGNATDCKVGSNGENPLKKGNKDYEAYILDIIPNQMCLSAKAFFQLSMPEQRKWLEESFSEYTQDEIIDKNPEYEPIRQALKNGTVEANLKDLRSMVYGDRTKKGLVRERDDEAVKVENAERKRAEIDIDRLTADKEKAEVRLADVRATIEGTDKRFEEYDKLSSGVIELKFKLSDMERKANEENISKRRELQQQIDVLTVAKTNAEKAYSYNKDEIARLEKDIPIKEELTEKYRDEWRAAESREFDETKAICPYCGQELPEDKKEPLRIEFKEKKKAEKDDIAAKGNHTKEIAESEKRDLERLKTANTEYEKKIPEMTAQLQDLQRQHDAIPQFVDISGTEEYQNLKKEIADKEQAMNVSEDIKQARRELNVELEAVVEAKTLIESDIQKWYDLKNEAKEHREKQIELSQQIADIEKKIKLFKDFDFLKCSLLEESINRHFKYVKWKLSDTQVNGDLRQVCYCMVNGEPYNRNLNKGARILAEIDVCQTTQEKYGIIAPIIMDDIESLDPWRIPEIENQLILIGRTNDKKLTWENYGSVQEMK